MAKKGETTSLIYKKGGQPETTLMGGDSPVLLAAPFAPDDSDDIGEPEVVNSVRDICDRYRVQITGDVQLPDGSTKPVAIDVVDEVSYTHNGMTVGNEQLLKLYAGARALEAYGRYLHEDGAPLGEADLDELKRGRQILLDAEQGD